ncbi:MAG: molybdopterin converting factor subunit 1 [Deltaproteobacteria bacterium]|nr:molybdopterin converting factor subunit 1 [Deltaproteobacteria bacterium]
MAALNVRILLFAGLRERLRKDKISLVLPEGTPAKKVLRMLFKDEGEADRIGKCLLFAVNETYVGPDAVLRDGDELALIPPVAGG